MSPLAKRFTSAAVGILVIAGLTYWLQNTGILIVAFVVAIGASLEFANLIYGSTRFSKALHYLFLCLCGLVMATSVFYQRYALVALLICTLVLLSTLVLSTKLVPDLSQILRLQAMSALGLLYCGCLPAMVTKLVFLPHGQAWFFCFLAIVFASDTFAYFFGLYLGKKKLLEAISPKKTVSGSFGGLLGCAVIVIIYRFLFLPSAPLLSLVFLAVISGAFAQMGDMFESLLKRVAQVKDSGTIMPGHGGLLDRVDGVYFAAPIFYLAAVYLVSR